MRIAILPLMVCLAASAAQASSARPDVCNFISSVESGLYGEYLRDFTQRQGWVDANNDGVTERVYLLSDGTAHVTRASLSLNNTTLPLSMRHEEDAEEFRRIGWGLQDQQWLDFHGETYLLSMLNGSDRLPSHVWQFTPDYSGAKICGFAYDKNASAYATKEALQHFAPREDVPTFNVPQFCMDAVAGNIDTYLPPQEMTPVQLGDATSANRYIMADINNDGHKEKLLYARFASGGGAGCDADMLVTAADTAAFVKRKHDALSPLGQRLYDIFHLRFGEFLLSPDCKSGLDPRLFTYQGHTFLERGDLSAPVHHAQELTHEIWYMGKGAAFPACRFAVHPKMRQVFP